MSQRTKRAFTLVELLVVIAIIGILIALLLPAVQAAREAARRSQCTNNQKQLVLSLHNYHDVYKTFPPGSVAYSRGGFGTLNQSWITRVLPFIEMNTIDIDMVNDGTLWTGSPGTTPGTWQSEVVLAFVLCPSDSMKKIRSTFAPTNYVASTGSDERFGRATSGNARIDGRRQKVHQGVFRRSTFCSMAEVKDGTSNTMAISECKLGDPFISDEDSQDMLPCMGGNSVQDSRSNYPRGWSWYAAKYPQSWGFNTLLPPNDRVTAIAGYECESGGKGSQVAMTARSFHPGGVNVGMTDGSVRFVADTVDIFAWRAASTRYGKEAIGL